MLIAVVFGFTWWLAGRLGLDDRLEGGDAEDRWGMEWARAYVAWAAGEKRDWLVAHGISLTDAAATKVKNLLEQEGRDGKLADMRQYVRSEYFRHLLCRSRTPRGPRRVFLPMETRNKRTT